MLSSEPLKVWPRVRKLTNEQLLAIYVRLDHGGILPRCARTLSFSQPDLNAPRALLLADMEPGAARIHITLGNPGWSFKHILKLTTAWKKEIAPDA